jgi:hypothetical protein
MAAAYISRNANLLGTTRRGFEIEVITLREKY